MRKVKMRRNVLVAALMLLLSATTMSVRAANVEYLTFIVKGTPVIIVLAEHPVITYTGNTLHVQTTEGNKIDIPVQDVSGTSFSETAGINKPAIADMELKAGKMMFSKLPAGSKVTVYTVDGKTISTINVGNDQQAVVDTQQLGSGVYIIKSATQTIKITNK